jgi:hypothetical protein
MAAKQQAAQKGIELQWLTDEPPPMMSDRDIPVE